MKRVRSKITRREKLMKRYRISYEDVSTILEREKKGRFYLRRSNGTDCGSEDTGIAIRI